MSLDYMHLEIAKERFLELMAAESGRNSSGTAVQAIEQADDFVKAYQAIVDKIEPARSPKLPPRRKQKGCPACFGSGGKPIDPCNKCHGTGKVDA